MATGQINSTGTIPPGAIGNSQISNQAVDRLDFSKLQPIFQPECNFGTAIGAAPVAKEEIKYTGKVGGTILGFHALVNVIAGTPTITFDLKKNGTTVLSAVISITIATTSAAVVNALLASTTFAAGDVFSYAMTVSGGGSCSGPNAWATFIENTAPTS